MNAKESKRDMRKKVEPLPEETKQVKDKNDKYKDDVARTRKGE